MCYQVFYFDAGEVKEYLSALVPEEEAHRWAKRFDDRYYGKTAPNGKKYPFSRAWVGRA